MGRRAWIVFIGWQSVALACDTVAEIFLRFRWGPQFWGASFVGLLPGNYLAAVLVERLLWNSGMTLRAMFALEIPIMLLVNAAAWWSVASAFRHLN
jgi:hypothetical protein